MFDHLYDYDAKLEGTHIFLEKPAWLSDSGMSLFFVSLRTNPDILDVEDFFGEIHITFSPDCRLSVPERINFLVQEIQLYYQPANKSFYLH